MRDTITITITITITATAATDADADADESCVGRTNRATPLLDRRPAGLGAASPAGA
ncbi:hypothetical protein WEI85_43345 [Actinomycetes bacterium KLBMP 9797]